MYDWNWSSFTEFKNCYNNTSLKKRNKENIQNYKPYFQIFQKCCKSFCKQNNIVIEAQTNFREGKTS